jgi:protein-tyrosine-phosphatase
MITLEYVCTGNCGRSPMAEVIAQRHVNRLGLTGKINVSSSGSGIHDKTMKTGDARKEQQLGVIKLGLNYGIFNGDMDLEARRVLNDDSQTEIDNCFDYIVQTERILRDMALWEVGLFAEGVYHQATDVHDDSRIILPMVSSNVEQVKTIYEGSGVLPYVVALNEFASLDGEIANPFCQHLPVYRETREDLLRVVPMSVEKAIEEFKL